MAHIKVLIIDDEKLLVKSTVMALGCYGFEAEGAADGPSGLEKAAAMRPGVILLDVMMPGMDGWEVLKKLKESPATKNIPVIVFTAKEYYNGRRMAAEQGAADYIAKPFELEELVALLKRHAPEGGRHGQ